MLERALARGGDFAELYAEARHGFAISLDDGRVERPQGGRERGACVRVVQGDSTYFGHVDGLAEEDLLRVADSVSQAVRDEAREPARLGAATRAQGHAIELRPEQVEVERKAAVLRSCDERARGARAGGRPRCGSATARTAARSRCSAPTAAPAPTTARACGSAPRSWRGATAASRPAPTRAAATPASS